MAMKPITVGLFKVYLHHLKQDLLHDRNAELLSEPLIYCLIHETLTDTYAIFHNIDTNIRDVANTLYSAYDAMCFEYPDKEYIKHDADDIHLLMEIRVVLKVIKYSCTIFVETDKDKSIFHTRHPWDMFMSDDDINPSDWVYLDYDQFTTKLLYSVGKNNIIARICPVTNYRLTNVFDIHNGFKGSPLFIINEASYKLSIKNMISKYILKNASELDKLPVGVQADCFYIGKLAEKFSKTCSDSLVELSQAFNNCLVKEDLEHELVFTLEYIPMRECGVSVTMKIFIFSKEKDLGYVLNSFIYGHVNSKFSFDYLGINARQEFLEEDLLHEIANFFTTNLIEAGEDDEDFSKLDVRDSSLKKAWKLAKNMVSKYMVEKPKPCIPDFIIYP